MKSGVSHSHPKALSRLEQNLDLPEVWEGSGQEKQSGQAIAQRGCQHQGRTVHPAMPFLIQTQDLCTHFIPLGHRALEGKGGGWASPLSSTVEDSEQVGEESGLAFVSIGPLSAMEP